MQHGQKRAGSHRISERRVVFSMAPGPWAPPDTPQRSLWLPERSWHHPPPASALSPFDGQALQPWGARGRRWSPRKAQLSPPWHQREASLTSNEARSKSSPHISSAWTWIQEQCCRLQVLKPMAGDDAISFITCVQTPMASAGTSTHLGRNTLDFCSPSCRILPETKLLPGAEDGEGETQTGEAKAKAVQSSYQITVSGNKRGMRESTITHLTGQASVNHHHGEVKISTTGAQRKPTWQTHLLNGEVHAAGAFKPPQPKEHGEGRGTPGAQSHWAQWWQGGEGRDYAADFLSLMDPFLAHPERGSWHVVSRSADGSAMSDVQLCIFNTQGSYYLFAG